MKPSKKGRIKKLKISTNLLRTPLNHNRPIRRKKLGAASENFGELCLMICKSEMSEI
jgi:hypothetical protein